MATQKEKMAQAVSLLRKLNIVLPPDFNFTSPNALSVLQGVIQTRNATADKVQMTKERANEIAGESVRSGVFRAPRRRDDELAGDNSQGRHPLAFSEQPKGNSIRCKCGGLNFSECTCERITPARANELANKSIRGQARKY